MDLTSLTFACFILWMVKDAPFFSVPAKNVIFILMLLLIVASLLIGLTHGPLIVAK